MSYSNDTEGLRSELPQQLCRVRRNRRRLSTPGESEGLVDAPGSCDAGDTHCVLTWIARAPAFRGETQEQAPPGETPEVFT